MASPFRAFRKYQKSLLAVAGVLLMFVFVLGDPLSQYMRRNSGGATGGRLNAEDVAVHWKSGSLTNAQLASMVQRRAIVNGFVREVEVIGRKAAFDAGGQPGPLTVEMLQGPERWQEGVEQDVARVRIFADAARAAGMNVSDENLSDYLQKLGRGFVSVDQIRDILGHIQVNGHRAATDYVLDALREELLARNYLAGYMFAFDAVMPEQRWADWLQVNDKVVVEAAAIPAESFVVDVAEPSDAELTAFYEKFKNDTPHIDRMGEQEFPPRTPGFKVPRKIDLQYIRADYDQLLAKAENQVKDEDVEKYYEAHKDPMFIRADSAFSESTKSDKPAATESQAAENKATEKPAADTEPATPSKDSGDKGAADAGSTPASTSGAKGANDAKPTQPAPSKAKPAKNKQSSTEPAARQSVFRLTAFADDNSTNQKSTGPEPAVATGGPDAAGPTEAIQSPIAGEQPKKAVQFQPLEEVRDEIRRQLAQDQVVQQLDTLMGKLEGDLNALYRPYFSAAAEAEVTGKDRPQPPAGLTDLSKLAMDNGLDASKVGPVSQLELRDTPLGKTAKKDDQTTPLVIALFASGSELYQPNVSFDIDNNQFLSVKTGDTPAHVPPLAEIRDEVVRAWKLQKAADLALKHAQDLAKQAQTAGKSLEDALADDKKVKITKTDPFAWLTPGSVSRDTQQLQSFRLGQPEGIVAAGPELLEKVFSLGEGEVGAALNHDHSIAYVLKVAEHQDTPAELRQTFLSEADQWYGAPAWARAHSGQVVSDVMTDMYSAAGIDWDRKADQPPKAADSE
jgi:hypothetical protein